MPPNQPCQHLGPRLLLGAAALAATAACQIDENSEPAKPVIHYSLSDATKAISDGVPEVPEDVQANVAGSLEMLFGTPRDPAFLPLDSWKGRGFDLNWPTFAVGEQGSGEFDEDELAELYEDNERAFRRELALIDEGRYREVRTPDWTPSLREQWESFLAIPDEKRDPDTALTPENARRIFVEFYPRLRDSSEMYRQQCLHCHGPEGGGNGPTAPFLNPRPRDYRLGTFKFTAVGKSVPRREDLFHILDQGVTGTSMPSFRRFAKAQIHGLVDYVRLLSMRGMVERSLVSTYAEEESLTTGDVIEAYTDVLDKWQKADERVLVVEGPVPEPTAETIERGRVLFMDATTGNCFSCHGADGRGDGASAFQANPRTGVIEPAYKDDWGHEIIPRNLRYGLFRGGRRPVDLYRRIKNGIAGTPMPEAASTLTNDDIWALVHYVGSISQRPRRVAAAHAPEGGHEAAPTTHETAEQPARH